METINITKNNTSFKKIDNKQEIATSLLDHIILWSIGLLIFLMPIFFLGVTSQGLGFEKMILFFFLTLIGVVAWATKGIIIGELTFKRTPLDIPILIFLTVLTISTFFSINQKDSLIGSYGNSARGLIAILIFILFYYLVVNNINKIKIKIYFWLFLISLSVLVIISFLQLLGVFILPFEFTRNINFILAGSFSALTIILISSLPLFVIAIAQTKEILPKLKNIYIAIIKIFFIIAILCNFAVLIMLSGFSFWPVAVIGSVIILMFFLSKVIKTSTNAIVVSITAFIISIILLVLGSFNLFKLNLPVEVSLSRGASWDITKNTIKNDPFFGSGPSTFYYDFSKFKNQEFNNSPLWNIRFDNASGILFEMLATTGVIGTLALVILILIGISLIFLSLVKIGDTDIQSILLSFFSSFVSIGIFALLFSFSNILIIFSVIIVTLTIALSVIVYPEKWNTLTLSLRASPKYALALAAVFLTISAGVVVLFTMGLKMFLADIYAKQSLSSANLNEKIEKLGKAIDLAPYQDIYYLEQSKNYMNIANNETSSGNKNQEIIENNLSLAINNGRKAVEISPNNASVNESLALIYENASFYTRGALEWSENYYNKVAELESTNPIPSLRIALINMARSNTETNNEEKKHYIEEAIKKYNEAIAKKSNLGAAHYGKAVANEKLGNLNDAIDNLKLAVLSDQNNIDYRFELGRMFFNRGVIQPNINQNASENITKGTATGTDLSVKPEQNNNNNNISKRNEDLNIAEQIFQGIIQNVPNHANALYSLALLYQKVGENDKAKINVSTLLNVLQDEEQKEFVKKQFPGLY